MPQYFDFPIRQARRTESARCQDVALEPATITYRPPDKASAPLYRALHAGLSPDEMRTPLCVC